MTWTDEEISAIREKIIDGIEDPVFREKVRNGDGFHLIIHLYGRRFVTCDIHTDDDLLQEMIP